MAKKETVGVIKEKLVFYVCKSRNETLSEALYNVSYIKLKDRTKTLAEEHAAEYYRDLRCKSDVLKITVETVQEDCRKVENKIDGQ